MFCCNCGHKAKENDKFCSACGFRLKEPPKSNTNAHTECENLPVCEGLFFMVEKVNGRQRNMHSGEWSHKKWAVHKNKTIVCETHYDGKYNYFSNKAEPPEVATKTYSLGDEAFENVKTILYDILQNYPATFASDGDIWKIKAYNQEGKEACSFAGSLDIKKVCEIENYL